MRLLGSFPAAVTKYDDKSHLRGKGFVLAHWSMLQSIMAKSQWEELIGAGHNTSAIKKRDQ